MKNQNNLSNLFLAFAVLILVGAIGFVNTGGRDDHERYFMNMRFYQTTSGSMEPTMRVNAVVVVQKAEITDFKVGDIVCFMRSGDAIAHRVIGVTAEGLQTKGDNNPIEDAALVLHDEIVGKCILTMNWVATVIESLETPAGTVKVIVLPILFVVTVLLAFAYLRMVNIDKKKKAEEAQKTTST